MNIAIIGASGRQGTALLKEAMRRGHDVTAIVRDESRLKAQPSSVLEKDILSLTTKDLAWFDVVIDAFGVFDKNMLYLHSTTLKHLAGILHDSVTRLLVVGGASSLYVDKSKHIRLLDSLGIAEDNTSVPGAMALAFDKLKTVDDVNWTYLSPPQDFSPDIENTGNYKTGHNYLLFNSEGKSEISYDDYAIAMIDEAEDAAHVKQRFTVVNDLSRQHT